MFVRLVAIIGIFCLDKMDGSVPEGAPILFRKMGEVSLRSTFAHLVIPIHMDDFKEAFDRFSDLETAYNSITTLNNNSFNVAQLELERLRSRLDVLHHLFLKSGSKTHFEQYDLENAYKDILISRLGNKLSKWQPESLETTNLAGSMRSTGESTSSEGNRRKRDMATVYKVFQLSSFALSLFTKMELSAIWKSARGQADSSKYVAALASDNLSRLKIVDNFMKKIYDVIYRVTNRTSSLHQETVRIAIRGEIDRMSRVFVSEMSDFLAGMQVLLENRISPLIVDPDKLQTLYADLLVACRAKSLVPVSEDSGIIYHSEVSVVGSGEGRLLVIVHVPVYQGSKMNLFRYMPSPFALNHDGVVVAVKSKKEFLALDSSESTGLELSLTDLQGCRRFGRLLHCKNRHVVTKDLDSMCLYALYNQNLINIESLCKVVVLQAASHAIQLDGNTFRVLESQPTQLIKQCSKKGRVVIVDGEYILKLDDECPTASTKSHYFERDKTVMSSGQILSIPLLPESSNWIKTIRDEFQSTDMKEILQDIKYEVNGPVSLERLRRVVREQEYNRYLTYLWYVQLVLTFLALLYILLIIGRWIKDRVVQFCAREKFKTNPGRFRARNKDKNDDCYDQTELTNFILKHYTTGKSGNLSADPRIVNPL